MKFVQFFFVCLPVWVVDKSVGRHRAVVSKKKFVWFSKRHNSYTHHHHHHMYTCRDIEKARQGKTSSKCMRIHIYGYSCILIWWTLWAPKWPVASHQTKSMVHFVPASLRLPRCTSLTTTKNQQNITSQPDRVNA